VPADLSPDPTVLAEVGDAPASVEDDSGSGADPAPEDADPTEIAAPDAEQAEHTEIAAPDAEHAEHTEQEAPAFQATPGTLDGPRAVLRWLVGELEADGAAYFQIGSGAVETLLIEPAGLSAAAVRALSARAAHALVGNGQSAAPSGSSSCRWLGVGGPKSLIVDGSSSDQSAEALRLARFAIEWQAALATLPARPELEDRLRGVPGVSYAEVRLDGDVWIVAAIEADRLETQQGVADVVGEAGVEVLWLDEPAGGAERAPRTLVLKEVSVFVQPDGSHVAAVRLASEGGELRGTGRGFASPMGRRQAVAAATVEALRELPNPRIGFDHVFATRLSPEMELAIAPLEVDEEPFVGTALVRPGEEDAAPARAVLDAVNRKLG